jgi:glycosyltransferase involved in cell wall biosynthesis
MLRGKRHDGRSLHLKFPALSLATAAALRIVIACHTRRGGTWVVGSHHLAREWARAGHAVLFISAPIELRHAMGARDSLSGSQSGWGASAPDQLEPRLQEWTPTALIPWTLGAHFGALLGQALPGLAVGVARTVRRTGFASPDLLVVDHPLFCNLDRVVGATRFAYLATDLYRDMHNRRIVDAVERRLISSADRVIATSQPIAQRLRGLGATHPIVIENGAEVAHFAKPAARPPEYQGVDAIRVVYAGALDFRFDAGLAMRLARTRPDIDFVIIGSGTAGTAMAASPLRNLRLLGPRPYSLLPGYLQHAHAGLLPLNDHPANAGRSPMKLYEYAAAGLPVLATRTPVLERSTIPFVRVIDPRAPERTLDALLRDRPLPDSEDLAMHDWSRIADRVLATALADAAGMP